MSDTRSSLSLSLRGKFEKAGLVLGVALAVVLICFPAFSQSGVGTIQGSVFDQTGAAIAGASVTVVDTARGINRPFTTDSAGAYNALNLLPGTYTVRAEAKGFQTIEHANVTVQVGVNSRVDLTLQPGAQTQTVTVTSEAPSVDTTDATLGGTVENSVMTALPLNGRNFQRLLQLRPGVVTNIGGGSGTSSTNGLRTGDDLQLVDGISAFAASTGNSILNSSYRAGDSTSLLPIDAIQEFNTEQNPKAEYGWKAGSIVNVGIKSGTNTLHGTAYAFGRDTGLDAGNPFINTGAGPTQVPLELEQYGATGGGRIIKNKLFWFAGYEGLHWLSGLTSFANAPEDLGTGLSTNKGSMLDQCNFLSSTVAPPTTGPNANVISGPYNQPGTSGPNGKLSPLSARLAGITVNGATGCSIAPASASVENLFPTNLTNSTNYNPGLLSSSPGNNGVFKGTYHHSDHNEFSGMYFRAQQDEQQAPNTALTPYWETFVPASTQAFDGLWTWTPNSTWVNEFRGGLAYIRNQTLAQDRAVNPANPWGLSSTGTPTGYNLNTGVDLSTFPLYGGLPYLKISGSSSLGAGNKSSVRGPEGSIDIVEHLSYLRGKHAFKFGFEYLDSIFDGNTYNLGYGNVNFKSLQNFLAGKTNGGVLLEGNPDYNGRSHNYAFFAQDDWRLKTRVTVNLGLRWTVTTPFVERNNYQGNFNPNANPATTPALQAAGPGAPLPQEYNTDWKSISPRLGIAWDVQGNGKTVVRLGTSILYGLMGGGDIINTVPFAANFPTVNANAGNPNGINTSGTAANLHSAISAPLLSTQINWSTSGTIFPQAQATLNNFNGVQTTFQGITCLPTSTLTYAKLTDPSPTVPGVPCASNVVASNFRPDAPVGEWNLDIQRAITNNLTIDVAYVGNHAWNVPSQERDLNQPFVGSGWFCSTTVIPCGGSATAPAANSGAAACLLSAASNYNNCIGNNTPSSSTTGNAIIMAEQINSPYFTKYPYLSYIDSTANDYYSNYNGLQVTATMRATHGLSFLAGFTYAHALDFVSAQSSQAGPMDIYHENLNYGNGSNDIRNRFTFSTTYTLPGLKFAPAQLLQGWSVNAIFQAQGGSPWWASDANNDFPGTGEVNAATSGNATGTSTDWNYTGPASAFRAGPQPIPCFGPASGCTPFNALPSGLPVTAVAGTTVTVPTECLNAAEVPYSGNATLKSLADAALVNFGCFVQGGGILTPPAFGTIGNSGRDVFRGLPYYNVDFSVTKDWKFKERYGVQFRAEFFNLFNWTEYANPSSGNLDPSSGAGSGSNGFGQINATPNNGNPVLGSGGPRTIQFGLKLSF